MNKHQLLNDKLKVEICDITVEGKGIARLNNNVYFVEQAIPKDIAYISVLKKKRKFFEAKIETLIQPSEYREKPICKHFGICGGCKWQHMNYEAQLKFKEKQVVDQFERIGKINAPHITIQPSKKKYYYRNKLEFTFSTNKWFINSEDSNEPVLGFHVPGRFDKVLNIEECFLQPEPSNKIRNFIKNFALSANIPFYNSRTHEGVLRNLIIRNNSAGEFMIILSLTTEIQPFVNMLCKKLQEQFPEISSFYLALNNKRNDSLDGVEIKLMFGKSFITEQILGYNFKLSPKAFMQINLQQTETLYKKIIEWGNFTGNEIVYDLYCGIGTIALIVAPFVKHVIGIEYVEEAINDAKENAKINQIHNSTFIAGDVKNIIKNNPLKFKPDVVILDPPRSGIHPDIATELLALKPHTIIYVSCNAATQARDIQLLSTSYKVVQYQPFDMFPQTSHVENIALLNYFSTK